MSENELVTLQTYSSVLQAQLASNLLANEGIYSLVADNHMSSLVGGGLVQVRLLVAKKNLNQAIETLFPNTELERRVFGGPELQ
jgi:chaperonin cofactor prefoldin